MRWPLALALVCLVLTGVPPGRARGPSVEGDRLAFRLPDLSGEIVDSGDARFQDRVLYVALFGTWCPPCLTEIPTLVDLQQRLGDDDLVVVAVAFEQEEDPDRRRAALSSFAAEQEINYLILDGGTDPEAALPALRNVRGLPFEIVIDRDGRVVDARHGYGYKKKWARRLESRLRQLLDATGSR